MHFREKEFLRSRSFTTEHVNNEIYFHFGQLEGNLYTRTGTEDNHNHLIYLFSSGSSTIDGVKSNLVSHITDVYSRPQFRSPSVTFKNLNNSLSEDRTPDTSEF